MKKLSKPILVVVLSFVLLIATTTTSFAWDDSDPYGKCIVPKYEAVK